MQRRFLVCSAFFLSILAAGCHSGSPTGATQTDSITQMREQLADSVKQEFTYAWEQYVRNAWGHDALKPISHSFYDWYSHPLLMTPLDGFDTMLLMGLKSQADSAKTLLVDSLRFDVDMSVSGFEVTIRMLGGLLSAYEMDGDKRFLKLAVDLAGRLIKAFDTPTGIPYRFINLKTGKATGNLTNPAEAGTMLLEYGTLTTLTGDSLYYKTAKRAVEAIYSRRSKKTGLVGSQIDVITGAWVDRESSISGGTDSYYEYLLKAWKLFGDEDCKGMWDSSILAINRHLADTSKGMLWYGRAEMDTGTINRPLYGALDAFFAGMLAMGGDTIRAIALQKSNYKMWTWADLEPETLNYRTLQITDGYYALRPENLESCYYLYQYTRDPAYLSMGAEMFRSLVRYCRTEGGYAAIKDVRNMVPDDLMESYFLAETLKYAYLLFAPEHPLDFNKVVFNTEAHPFRRHPSSTSPDGSPKT